MIDNKKVELLAPAGDYEKLVIAVLYGADAVYIGGEEYGLRAKAKNFDLETMKKGIEFAHSHGVKVYVTANIYAHNDDFYGMAEYFKKVYEIGADALLISDLGVFSVAKEAVPDMEIHVSTQANNTNYMSAKMWYSLGAKRVVAARELSLKEIKEVRKNIPDDMDIEAFVHGAMCISYSGRCLLSNYLTGRDSNKGACVQACRWKYYIREENRTDEMPIEEDERGTYILNSKDMCLIDHLKELEEAGIASLKIEGRMKSDYYVASVVNAYRRALDGFSDYKILHDELEKTSHRRYTTGFYFGADDKEYLEDSMPVQTYVFIAVAKENAKDGKVKVEMRNRFKVGDELEILSSDNNFLKTIKIEYIKNSLGEFIDDAKRVQEIVEINCPYDLKEGDILRVEKK